jgi:hypothetical protein
LLDLKALHEILPARIESLHACSTDPRISADHGKLVIDIETPDFLAILSAWSNGCVDLDLLPRGAADGVAWHGEFTDTASALDALVEVIRVLPDLPE